MCHPHARIIFNVDGQMEGELPCWDFLQAQFSRCACIAYKNKWLCSTCSFHSAAVPQYAGVRTINRHQLPVRVSLFWLQGEGEGLGIGGAVCITGLDENRFKFLHTHVGLIFRQFGDVVVHIQYSHRKNVLRGLLGVGFRRKSKIITQKLTTLVSLSCIYSMKKLFMSKAKDTKPSNFV